MSLSCTSHQAGQLKSWKLMKITHMDDHRLLALYTIFRSGSARCQRSGGGTRCSRMVQVDSFTVLTYHAQVSLLSVQSVLLTRKLESWNWNFKFQLGIPIVILWNLLLNSLSHSLLELLLFLLFIMLPQEFELKSKQTTKN